MKGELKKEGKYELFKTSRGHQVVRIGNEHYALVQGQKGNIIVKSDSNHEKDKTLSEGKYFYADFKNDPEFQDTPHLFLEDGDQFQEMILPEGFPKEKDYQKKLVRPNGKISKNKVMEHLK